jgi:hypothetical protein
MEAHKGYSRLAMTGHAVDRHLCAYTCVHMYTYIVYVYVYA